MKYNTFVIFELVKHYNYNKKLKKIICLEKIVNIFFCKIKVSLKIEKFVLILINYVTIIIFALQVLTIYYLNTQTYFDETKTFRSTQ